MDVWGGPGIARDQRAYTSGLDRPRLSGETTGSPNGSTVNYGVRQTGRAATAADRNGTAIAPLAEHSVSPLRWETRPALTRGPFLFAL
jgi:hypothetical protein